MRPKPDHLGPEYGGQFADTSVARAYHTRPPYPAELFDLLVRLLPQGVSAALDLGCGVGDIALGLRGRVDRIDAVDPSAPMLAVARARHRSGADGLQWVHVSAEEFLPGNRYGLIVAAESLHWMDWERVFDWMPDALVPGGSLTLVTGRELTGVPWEAELRAVIPRFSTNQRFRPYDLVDELTMRGLFEERGRATTTPREYRQSVDDYVESFHTRNGFSRDRMTPDAASVFDDTAEALARRTFPDGWVRGWTSATAIWGIPHRPASHSC